MLDATAATNRLIVDGDVAMRRAVFVECLGKKRVDERRPGTGQLRRGEGRRDQERSKRENGTKNVEALHRGGFLSGTSKVAPRVFHAHQEQIKRSLRDINDLNHDANQSAR